tara:strand:- start:661 stop:870 length:210 start_codon:yes stop_codon:yes gene_type:complete
LQVGCYILRLTSIKLNRKIWVTQKSTEAEENRAPRKEELKEKIRKNNILRHFLNIVLPQSILIFNPTST